MTEEVITRFSDLALAAPILKAIAEVGYETPSPIQARTIPPLLYADMVVQSGTNFDGIGLQFYFGLGDDGHTASLFPGLKAVHEQQRWVAAERVDKAGMWRITLTPPVINASAVVSFLVAGEAKAAMLARVVEGPIDIDERPAQVVRPASGELFWLIDAAAGSQLQRGRIVDATAGPPTGGEHA